MCVTDIKEKKHTQNKHPLVNKCALATISQQLQQRMAFRLHPKANPSSSESKCTEKVNEKGAMPFLKDKLDHSQNCVRKKVATTVSLKLILKEQKKDNIVKKVLQHI